MEHSSSGDGGLCRLGGTAVAGVGFRVSGQDRIGEGASLKISEGRREEGIHITSEGGRGPCSCFLRGCSLCRVPGSAGRAIITSCLVGRVVRADGGTAHVTGATMSGGDLFFGVQAFAGWGLHTGTVCILGGGIAKETLRL